MNYTYTFNYQRELTTLTTEAPSPEAGKQKCIAALAKKYCVSRQKMVGYFTDKLNCEVVCLSALHTDFLCGMVLHYVFIHCAGR